MKRGQNITDQWEDELFSKIQSNLNKENHKVKRCFKRVSSLPTAHALAVERLHRLLAAVWGLEPSVAKAAVAGSISKQIEENPAFNADIFCNKIAAHGLQKNRRILNEELLIWGCNKTSWSALMKFKKINHVDILRLH